VALPADYLPFQVLREPLFDGEGEHACAFYLSKPDLEKIKEDGPTWKFYDARLIPEVLKNPTVVFEDLKREGFHDAYCYVGKPGLRYVASQSRVPAPENLVFAVYVKKVWGLVVFDWDWREESQADPGYPTAWEQDFGRRVWPTT
jgi:hypothetical protein